MTCFLVLRDFIIVAKSLCLRGGFLDCCRGEDLNFDGKSNWRLGAWKGYAVPSSDGVLLWWRFW